MAAIRPTEASIDFPLLSGLRKSPGPRLRRARAAVSTRRTDRKLKRLKPVTLISGKRSTQIRAPGVYWAPEASPSLSLPASESQLASRGVQFPPASVGQRTNESERQHVLAVMVARRRRRRTVLETNKHSDFEAQWWPPLLLLLLICMSQTSAAPDFRLWTSKMMLSARRAYRDLLLLFSTITRSHNRLILLSVSLSWLVT